MSKWYIAVGIGLIVVGGLFFLVPGGGDQSQDGSVPAKPVLFTLSALSADVSLLEPEATENVVILEEVETVSGSVVSTSPQGRAIAYSTEQVSTAIDSNTEVVLLGEESEGEHTTIMLSAGSIWSRISRALEQDEEYIVRTPTLVAAVRGTSFGTEVKGGTTTLLIIEGVVEVTAIDEETNQPIASTMRRYTEGAKVIASAGVLRDIELSDPDRSTEWFIFNNPNRDTATSSSIQIAPTGVAKPSIKQPGSSLNEPTQSEPNPDPLTVSSVSPDLVTESNDGTLIKVRGTGFSDIVSVFADSRQVEITIQNDAFFYIDEREITNNGTYDLTITNARGESVMIEDAFVVDRQDTTTIPATTILDPQTGAPPTSTQ